MKVANSSRILQPSSLMRRAVAQTRRQVGCYLTSRSTDIHRRSSCSEDVLYEPLSNVGLLKQPKPVDGVGVAAPGHEHQTVLDLRPLVAPASPIARGPAASL